MPSPARRFVPSLDVLEDRLTPAGTVTGSLLNGVWTITGDADANDITINSTGVARAFTLVGNGTTVTGVTSPTGVKSISIALDAGDDSVQFNSNTTRIKLDGSLTIDGGIDTNSVSGTNISVKKGLSITNGTHASSDSISLTSLSVGGNCTITNGDGDNDIEIDGSSAGFSKIAKNVTITNGAGADLVTFIDTNVGGNLIDNNGSGDGTDCGRFWFFNSDQTTKRAIIGGSVTVTFLDGDTDDHSGIWDTTVQKSVTFNLGSGSAELDFDGFTLAKPVQINGSLTINGSGLDNLRVGTEYLKTGLHVGKNMTITFSNPAIPEFNDLFVKGKFHFYTT